MPRAVDGIIEITMIRADAFYNAKFCPSEEIHGERAPAADRMNAIATFMQNQTAVITVVLIGTPLGFVGVWVILAMFGFVQLMTSSMELQYGPAGPVVEYSFYALGGFLCVLGYARPTLHVLRGRNS